MSNSCRMENGRCGMCGGDWSVCGCQGFFDRQQESAAAPATGAPEGKGPSEWPEGEARRYAQGYADGVKDAQAAAPATGALTLRKAVEDFLHAYRQKYRRDHARLRKDAPLFDEVAAVNAALASTQAAAPATGVLTNEQIDAVFNASHRAGDARIDTYTGARAFARRILALASTQAAAPATGDVCQACKGAGGTMTGGPCAECYGQGSYEAAREFLASTQAEPSEVELPVCPMRIVEAIADYGDARADGLITEGSKRFAKAIEMIRDAIASHTMKAVLDALASTQSEPSATGALIASVRRLVLGLVDQQACPDDSWKPEFEAICAALASTQAEPSEVVLRKILEVVRRYLPPDGIDIKQAMSEIIGLVDPWPLASAPTPKETPK